jgi:hypothetical protein
VFDPVMTEETKAKSSSGSSADDISFSVAAAMESKVCKGRRVCSLFGSSPPCGIVLELDALEGIQRPGVFRILGLGAFQCPVIVCMGDKYDKGIEGLRKRGVSTKLFPQPLACMERLAVCIASTLNLSPTDLLGVKALIPECNGDMRKLLNEASFYLVKVSPSESKLDHAVQEFPKFTKAKSAFESAERCLLNSEPKNVDTERMMCDVDLTLALVRQNYPQSFCMPYCPVGKGKPSTVNIEKLSQAADCVEQFSLFFARVPSAFGEIMLASGVGQSIKQAPILANKSRSSPRLSMPSEFSHYSSHRASLLDWSALGSLCLSKLSVRDYCLTSNLQRWSILEKHEACLLLSRRGSDTSGKKKKKGKRWAQLGLDEVCVERALKRVEGLQKARSITSK